MVTALAYHVPFALWTLLCLGALVAFMRAVTAPPRDDLETRGVFSTLSERLGNTATAAHVRRALLVGTLVGVPLAIGACRLVWRAEVTSEWSTLVVVAVGWLLLAVGGATLLVLVVGSRRRGTLEAVSRGSIPRREGRG